MVRWIASVCAILLWAVCGLTAGGGAGVFAAERTDDSQGAPVIRAQDIHEYIELTSPDFSDVSFDVNKHSGRITKSQEKRSFEDTFGIAFDEVDDSEKDLAETIDSAEGYAVAGETKKVFHVDSDYGMHRVVVYRELKENFGAQSAVVFRGRTLLTYGSEAETKEGLDILTRKYGEDAVHLDFMVTMDPCEGEPGEGGTESESKGWGTRAMNLDQQIRQYEGCEKTVRIAVLDTGIHREHEIFKDTVISGDSLDFVDPEGSCEDDQGHGTMVAGVIAESTPSNVELLVLKVLKTVDGGKPATSWETAEQAMQYAREKKADIMNLSFGGYYPKSDCQIMDRSLAELARDGIVVCCASGNMYGDMEDTAGGRRFYPADSAYTISVGSVDQDMHRPSFSNVGDRLDFSAPGAGLALADHTSEDQYRSSQGTSFSCPYISSCAAFLVMANASYSRDDIQTQMIRICDDLGEEGKDREYGYGMPDFSHEVDLSPLVMSGLPEVTLSETKLVYDGKEKHPTAAVSWEGRTIASYQTEYPDDATSIGTHPVRVTLLGNYTDTICVTRSFTIVPGKVTIKKALRPKDKTKAKIKWSKSQGTYKLRVATDKNFKKYKTCSASGTSKTIRGLRPGKTYYVKVRAVKKADGKKYYSAWSATTVLKGKKRN